MNSHDHFVGQPLFGEYQIVQKLGEGGMGSVYLARNEQIQQDIAIKILHGKAAESEEIRQRFQREARVISMLTHPNIVRVFIFGRTDADLLYMAMEFVRGRSLRQQLAGGMVDELTAIKIIKQCCSALAEAHDLGIVHRDLKPDNILLTEFRGEDSYVKVLDFGIAKITDTNAQQQQLTQAGIVYGTPEYLSPEQAQAQDLDQRTDIYSLGVILYEMMTGRVPFQSQSAVQVLTMHVFNEPEPAENVAPQRVSPTMAKVIAKAMAKKREDRYATAMDLFRALDAREREILDERRMDSQANAIPGEELTGLFNAVDAGPNPQLPQAPADAPTQAVAAPGGQLPLPQSQQQLHFNPQLTPGPTAQTPASQPDDPNRKIMISVLVLMTVIVIALAAVLGWMLVNK